MYFAKIFGIRFLAADVVKQDSCGKDRRLKLLPSVPANGCLRFLHMFHIGFLLNKNNNNLSNRISTARSH